MASQTIPHPLRIKRLRAVILLQRFPGCGLRDFYPLDDIYRK
jgi:hypothetical protein